jgi:hypothetical protein
MILVTGATGTVRSSGSLGVLPTRTRSGSRRISTHSSRRRRLQYMTVPRFILHGDEQRLQIADGVSTSPMRVL